MKVVILLLIACCAYSGYAQDTTELVRRNGFKGIHLGSAIDSVKGAHLKKNILEKDEFPVSLYEIDDPAYKLIGEVKVKAIKVMAYRSLIYQINVTTEKDGRVIPALEKSFGKGMYIARDISWKWAASKLSLTFYSHKKDLELVYRSQPVIQKMYEDKGKKLDAIAEGF